jgi:hypothetical protein
MLAIIAYIAIPIAATIPATIPVTTVRTTLAGVSAFWLTVFPFAVVCFNGFMGAPLPSGRPGCRRAGNPARHAVIPAAGIAPSAASGDPPRGRGDHAEDRGGNETVPTVVVGDLELVNRA